MELTSRGRGRPVSETAREQRIEIRVTAAEKADIERAAGAAGLTVSEWLRAAAVSGAKPAPRLRAAFNTAGGLNGSWGSWQTHASPTP